MCNTLEYVDKGGVVYLVDNGAVGALGLWHGGEDRAAVAGLPVVRVEFQRQQFDHKRVGDVGNVEDVCC